MIQAEIAVVRGRPEARPRCRPDRLRDLDRQYHPGPHGDPAAFAYPYDVECQWGRVAKSGAGSYPRESTAGRDPGALIALRAD